MVTKIKDPYTLQITPLDYIDLLCVKKIVLSPNILFSRYLLWRNKYEGWEERTPIFQDCVVRKASFQTPKILVLQGNSINGLRRKFTIRTGDLVTLKGLKDWYNLCEFPVQWEKGYLAIDENTLCYGLLNRKGYTPYLEETFNLKLDGPQWVEKRIGELKFREDSLILVNKGLKIKKIKGKDVSFLVGDARQGWKDLSPYEAKYNSLVREILTLKSRGLISKVETFKGYKECLSKAIVSEDIDREAMRETLLLVPQEKVMCVPRGTLNRFLPPEGVILARFY